jgi:transketolase
MAFAAKLSPADLLAKCKQVRREIITSTTTAGSGHPTSSLSGVEVAVALYFGGVMRYDPKNPTWPQRDRFILSKGHAAPPALCRLGRGRLFPA